MRRARAFLILRADIRKGVRKVPYSPSHTDIFSDQAGQFVLMESRSLTNCEQGVKVQTDPYRRSPISKSTSGGECLADREDSLSVASCVNSDVGVEDSGAT